MSVVAKILIVLNLVLAVAFLSGAASFHGQKEAWKKTYEDLDAATSTEIADLKETVQAKEGDFRQQQQKANDYKNERDTAIAKVEQADAANVQLKENFNRLQADLGRLSETYKQALAQIDQLRNDKNTLINEKDVALTEKRDAIGKMNDAQVEQKRLESELMDLTDKAAGLEKQIVAMAKEIESAGVMLQAYKDKFGTITEWINVPALTAKVTGVNAEHNIVILSIGMDDGVKAGYEFTLYRGDKYVGKVIVDDVQKDHCSGYSKKELQAGDIAVGDDARTRW
jgi:DNA repair exonuclease SbcCD ATPase subunit